MAMRRECSPEEARLGALDPLPAFADADLALAAVRLA
jgi:hypothetical protein